MKRAYSILIYFHSTIFILLLSAGLFAQNDSLDYYYISKITISGNDKTKDFTILRELAFSEGDSVLIHELDSEIKTSKHNLLNTPLFNYVEINYTLLETSLDIGITVEERWYLWPEAAVYYIDRNFSNWLKERDWSKVDIGLGLKKYNLRGRNEKLSLFTFFGYDEEILVQYENLYLDKRRIHALGFKTNLKRRKETTYGIIDDKVRQIQSDDEYILKSARASIRYSFRNGVFNTHSISLQYEGRYVSDSVLTLNPEYHYSTTNSSKYVRIQYNFIRDKRNYRTFPTHGHLIDLRLSKYGLSIFPESGINSLIFDALLSKYSKLSNKFSLNSNITLKKTFLKDMPFFINTALGYTSSMRAYEYDVINGRDMFLSKNTLNYELFPKEVFHLRFIPWDKFNKIHFTIYASAFFDFAYVQNSKDSYVELNTLQNQWIYGFGAGFNLLTYYDKLLRVEYSLNKENKGGFFVHFEAPF